MTSDYMYFQQIQCFHYLYVTFLLILTFQSELGESTATLAPAEQRKRRSSGKTPVHCTSRNLAPATNKVISAPNLNYFYHPILIN